MNKTELIAAIQEELGPETTKRMAAEALNATLSAISKAVATEKVQLVGFGTFETKKRAARTGHNPATGNPLSIAASSYVAFKASSALKSKG